MHQAYKVKLISPEWPFSVVLFHDFLGGIIIIDKQCSVELDLIVSNNRFLEGLACTVQIYEVHYSEKQTLIKVLNALTVSDLQWLKW